MNDDFDDEQMENNDSDTGSIKNAGKEAAKEAAKKAAKKATKELAKKASKKAAAKLGATTVMASPVGWGIAIAILIIIIIVGVIGFVIMMPGLIKNKITDFVAKTWSNITGNKADAITQQDISDVKKYLSDMGIDLVGFGFVKNPENAVYNEEDQEYPKDDNDGYIEAYLAAQLETYSFETEGEFFKFMSHIPLFNLIIKNDKPTGMIRFKNDKAGGLFDTTLNGIVTYKEDNSGNMKYKTNYHDFHIAAWLDNLFSTDGYVSYEAKIKNEDDTVPELIVKTKTSLFSDTTERKYNLRDWTEQYGLPSYFLIALHIGTMAPDFALTVATTIKPKVEFDFAVSDVETTIIRDMETNECAEENMEHEWDDLNATTLPNKKKLSKCLNGCGAECEWSLDASGNEIRTIRKGRKSESTISYKTLIPYITKVKTWYKIFDYGKIAQSNDPQELPEYAYDGDDENLQGAIIKEKILNPLKMDSSKVKETDNSQYFRALLTSDRSLISKENFENNSEGYEDALDNIDFIDEEGYKIYPGTKIESDDKLKKKKIEPTSTMQMAIEMIESAPGSGSKVIARELKKILADYDFVIHNVNYPTTVSEARLSTFDFILPSYYPSLWPTAEETKTDCTKILAANGDEEGFVPNSKVIMPATGTIEAKSSNSITLKFTEQNSYGMTMIIRGISPESDIITNEDNEVTRKTVIGITGTEDITIILRDKNNQLLPASEYMDAIYLRYPAIISKGLAYPVYYQKQSPWGDIYFYKHSESLTDEKNKTYEDVGSGSAVVAMALSGITRLTVTPEAIKYRIKEIGLDVDKYVKEDGLNVEILQPLGDTKTNKFLDSFNVEAENLGNNKEKIKKATEEGYPVIVYATYTQSGQKNKQYFLLLPSSNEHYDYYLLDPKESKNNGFYNSDNFTELSYDTELNIQVAYALRKQM